MSKPDTTSDDGAVGRAEGAGEPRVAVLGVRHHGPGSARAVAAALAQYAPDRVLIEGPADAGALIPLVGAAEMEPPVALFGYREQDPQTSAFWPFAAFSPEWSALRYALGHEVPVAFCDLPAAVSLGMDRGGDGNGEVEPGQPFDEEAGGETVDAPAEPADEPVAEAEQESAPEPARRRDPISQLAEAAGYDDGETWWEDVVEHRLHATGALDAFAAVAEAMAAVRADEETSAFDAVREAHMRTAVRTVLADGARRIAVVCGAYHVPAILGIEKGKASGLPSAKDDKAALATLPKPSKATATALTWVPWTHSRLSYYSGYGAGISSPGWYRHLFENDDYIAERWLTRVAILLRKERVPVSSAHLIEGVRLAETLSTLRARPQPGLAELTEATVAVLCEGSAERLSLVERELVVGDILGTVPPDTPVVPLAADLTREAKRLRLPKAVSEKNYDLDLRTPNDLDRSKLLRRLALLGVPWGEPGSSRSRSTGTFRESWRVVWEPGLEVKLVEAAVWGTTVPGAATARMLDKAVKETSLARLTGFVEQCLAADLPEAVGPMVSAVHNRAAVDTDIAELAGALPPLVNVLRYRDVRGTRVESLTTVVRGLGIRLSIGLLGACVGIDDQPAIALAGRMSEANAAIQLLEDPEVRTPWTEALTHVADSEGAHGMTAGRAVRLLSDSGVFDTDAVAERMARALAHGTEPARTAAWLEGFLAGSGLVLAHDKAMLRLIDAWISGLEVERFETVLPLLRRTFGTFAGPERRAIADQLPALGSATPTDEPQLDDVADTDAPAWLLAARMDTTATIRLLLTGTGAMPTPRRAEPTSADAPDPSSSHSPKDLASDLEAVS